MNIKKQLKNLPTTSGVYLFRDSKREILYIGKAVNLKNRVRSHFNNPKLWLDKVAQIETQPTNSEITALILESQLIKKYRPPYNVQWKDDKNYFYVAITQEEWPRIFITHQSRTPTLTLPLGAGGGKLQTKNHKLQTDFIGPLVDGSALKSTLRVLRKIFPFRSCHVMPKHSCLQHHLGRCLAPCLLKRKSQSEKRKATVQKPKDQLLAKEYRRNINIIIKILRGQQMTIIKRLKNTMVRASQKQNFEQAAKIRDQIAGLEKVLAHSSIIKPLLNKKVLKTKNYKSKMVSADEPLKTDWYGRVEAYDISNISGELAVGSMIVFENGQPKKSDYRRFKIKTIQGANDIAMIKEVLRRRLKHHEWPWPDTILIDGGQAQLNIARQILQTTNYQLKTHVFSLAKKQEKLYNTKNQSPTLLAKLKPEVGFLIQRIRDEAHRFALNYHRQLRKNNYYDPFYL